MSLLHMIETLGESSMNRGFFSIFVGVAALLAMQAGDEAQAQGQPKVALYKLTDPTDSGIALQLREQLQVALVNTKKFSVFSRDFSSAEEEAQLRRAGKTTRNASNSSVQFEAVDYAIEGSITAASRTVEETPGIVLFGYDPGLCRTESVSIIVNITVRDGNGQFLYATPITKSYKKSCKLVDMAVLTSEVSNELVFKFAAEVFPMKVMAVRPDGSIVLNYGSAFLPIGTYVKISSPATAGEFGGFGSELGRARVSEANAEAALARMEGKKPVAVPIGSIARIDENQKRSSR